MPALPTSPSTVSSFLVSPLVGLCLFVLALVSISGFSYFGSLAFRKLCERRRVRIADAENAVSTSVLFVEPRPAGPAKSAAIVVLVAARDALHAQKNKASAVSDRRTLHKTLMSDSQHTISKPVHSANLPIIGPRTHITRVLLRHQGEKNASQRVVAHRSWTLPGQSPLRSVYTAPEVEVYSAPFPAVLEAVEPVPDIAPVSPAVMLTRSARILARLHASDSGLSDASYLDEDTEDAEDCVSVAPSSAPDEDSMIPLPVRASQPRVLVSARLGNLCRAVATKRSPTKIPSPHNNKTVARSVGKRPSVRERREKENGAQASWR
ncbi:hypothetical protein B0H15DRAFT_954569 [Mycena belliarum]|uniref:Uncharacterized protein n=1 Tax=Mycena belliarum TaxID=1033014 RepID=A0AAD6TV38_9AGAR|nr:hypothetical protein B0H15DRAFT_954569 [Mycena belliae]